MRSARAACCPCCGKHETISPLSSDAQYGANLGSHSNSQSVCPQIVATGTHFRQRSNQDRIQKKLKAICNLDPHPPLEGERRPLPIRERHYTDVPLLD